MSLRVKTTPKGVPITDVTDVREAASLPRRTDEIVRVTLATPEPPLAQQPLLWTDDLPAEIVAEHERREPHPPLAVYAVPDAIVIDQGWVVRRDAVLWREDWCPIYVRHYVRLGWTEPCLAPAERDAICVDRCWNAWHFGCQTYGHWLVEGVPKLLAIRRAVERWPDLADAPLALPSDAPAVVGEAVRALVPGLAILDYDPLRSCVAALQLLVPSWGREHFHHPAISEEIDAIASAGPPPSSERIFVSRGFASEVRRLVNGDAVEAIATEHGFAILRPEDHGFAEQLAAFRGARVLVGEFGSGLHNAIFAPRGARVIALNWVNALQSRIGQLREQRIGYLLPVTGVPVLFRRDREEPEAYEIAEDLFERRLAEIVGAEDRRR